ncbi:MAG: DJ-1/PfpI family protein [Acidimicrobiales bacterium]
MSLNERMIEVADRIQRSAAEITRTTSAAGRRVADTCSHSWERIRPDGQPSFKLAPGTLEPLYGWPTAAPKPDQRDPVSNSNSNSEEQGPDDPPDIAVLVYRGVSSSEVQLVGDALARPFGARVRLVSAEPGAVVAIEPARMIVAEPLNAVERPYGLVIPGGLAWKREAERAELIEWLTRITAEARGVIAVSTGSLLLAAIGLLDGQSAAGHWLADDLLAELGAEPCGERFVHGRLIATASGAFAGVEAAEALAKEMRFSV